MAFHEPGTPYERMGRCTEEAVPTPSYSIDFFTSIQPARKAYGSPRTAYQVSGTRTRDSEIFADDVLIVPSGEWGEFGREFG